eukprot:TRINITY_DN5606_c0_g1_i1.p1 TRINITY_DN5606_c0_g1~~TRINITY_DN5606_c0_g1_i1.p1  ORF type:complete len:495 (-),score=89.41 TRINITY_DN5606_c0_g1_i1:88-1572(-)
MQKHNVPVNFPLSEHTLSSLVEETTLFCHSNGLLMSVNGFNQQNLQHNSLQIQPISLTLLPSPFPRHSFEEAKGIAKDFNLLVHNLSQSEEFLTKALEVTIQGDEFTARLFKIFKQTIAEKTGFKRISLGLFRSDYMLHYGSPAGSLSKPLLQQVELNTISSAFPNLSHLAGKLFRYTTSRCGLEESYPQERIPVSNSSTAFVDAFAHAFALYKKEFNIASNDAAVIVMICQPSERNVFDQKLFEFELWERHRISMIRRTLSEIYHNGELDQTTLALKLEGKEVAISYSRAGYTPNDYPSEKEWEARLKIDRSRSIKCPSISHHLVGCKKIQQVIATPGVLEKFVPKETAERQRKCFAGLYSLDKGKDEPIIKEILKRLDDFVLKPQREGGGNNIYGQDIVTALSTMSDRELEAFIAMEKIRPLSFPCYVIRNGQSTLIQAISELGVYSSLISVDGDIVRSEECGHLLRTKPITSNEGGIAAGFAFIDSPFLFD